ncbi:MAG: hypothetical protein LUG95_02030 [Clostridiales bacterium]|nr:hypothetical protein [Clostridiales bacterium]
MEELFADVSLTFLGFVTAFSTSLCSPVVPFTTAAILNLYTVPAMRSETLYVTLLLLTVAYFFVLFGGCAVFVNYVAVRVLNLVPSELDIGCSP